VSITRETFKNCMLSKEDGCIVIRVGDGEEKQLGNEARALEHSLTQFLGSGAVKMTHAAVVSVEPEQSKLLEARINEINAEIANHTKEQSFKKLTAFYDYLFQVNKTNVAPDLIRIQNDYTYEEPKPTITIYPR